MNLNRPECRKIIYPFFGKTVCPRSRWHSFISQVVIIIINIIILLPIDAGETGLLGELCGKSDRGGFPMFFVQTFMEERKYFRFFL